MIQWAFKLTHGVNEDAVIYRPTPDQILQVNETDIIEIIVDIGEEYFSHGEPYLVIGDVPIELEFNHKGAPEKQKNAEFLPWYQLSETIKTTSWVFGHWASLMGQCSNENIYPLDTGCVWGNHLTMLRWHDKKFFTEPAHLKRI